MSAIGSVSPVDPYGRLGVVVGALPVGREVDGQQNTALAVRTLEGEGAKPGRPISGGSGSSANNGRQRRQGGGDEQASSTAENASLAQLRQRDGQVRQEETAHAAAAGDIAGAVQYDYEVGPDGRRYAVGGSVGVSINAGNAQQAERLGQRLSAAAMAAISPSGADQSAARAGERLQNYAKATALLGDQASSGNRLDIDA